MEVRDRGVSRVVKSLDSRDKPSEYCVVTTTVVQHEQEVELELY